MTWQSLYEKLGKQPLAVTLHDPVKAVIDGKTYQLKLKFEGNVPVLVPADQEEKPRAPYKSVIWYEVSREESNVLGSGSTTLWSEHFTTEASAWKKLKECSGNTLYRKVKTEDGKIETQYYDFVFKCWRDWRNNRLPY